jgi:hypothetical protein
VIVMIVNACGNLIGQVDEERYSSVSPGVNAPIWR